MTVDRATLLRWTLFSTLLANRNVRNFRVTKPIVAEIEQRLWKRYTSAPQQSVLSRKGLRGK